MKYTKTKLTPWLLLGLLLALSCYDVARATTTISSGHTDIFEAEYEQVGTNAPTVHLGVHTDDGHFEPGDVEFLVTNSAFTTAPTSLNGLLGSQAWILPIDGNQAALLGVIDAGVARVGFPSATPPIPVTFTLLSVGQNPGNFVLYTALNDIRLSSTLGTVGAQNSFSLVAGHTHYNWGFSAPGIYTFDMQASFVDPVHGNLQSPEETYTFNVVPEPSTGVLLMAGLATLSAVRRRTRR